MSCKTEDYCLYPKCECPIDFTEECLKGLPIEGHEDHEMIIGWTEEAFEEYDTPRHLREQAV